MQTRAPGRQRRRANDTLNSHEQSASGFFNIAAIVLMREAPHEARDAGQPFARTLPTPGEAVTRLGLAEALLGQPLETAQAAGIRRVNGDCVAVGAVSCGMSPVKHGRRPEAKPGSPGRPGPGECKPLDWTAGLAVSTAHGDAVERRKRAQSTGTTPRKNKPARAKHPWGQPAGAREYGRTRTS